MSKIALAPSASGTGTLTISAPNTNSDFTLALPAESGTALTTGTTTGISASALSTGTIPRARMFAGAVLQVLQTIKTDVFSTTSASFVDITGLSVAITPISATNKILVIANLQMQNTGSVCTGARLVRNSTAVFVGDAVGSRPQASMVTNDSAAFTWSGQNCIMFLDSPNTTSETTYKMQIYSGQGGETAYVGRSIQDNNSTDSGRTPAQITVMEIAA